MKVTIRKQLYKLVDKRILIISPEFWDHIFVSKHHYATELAKDNHVFFLNPPSKIFRLKSDLGVNIIDYQQKFRGINKLPIWLNKQFSKFESKQLLDCLNQSKFDIVWSFDPYRFQFRKNFNEDFFIYHPVDIHSTRLTHLIAKEADLIIAPSNMILSDYKESQTVKLKINHGLAQHFVQSTSSRKSSNKDLIVGYMGNLNYQYLDAESLKEIITNHPEIKFRFIGPYKVEGIHSLFVKFLLGEDNVEMIGKVQSNELPQYLNNCDLFIMAYKGDEFVKELANPHKILEFLSTGKVVLSHYIDEYKGSHLIEMVENGQSLIYRFDQIVEDLDTYNNSDLSASRINFAHKNTYANHIKTISKCVENQMGDLNKRLTT